MTGMYLLTVNAGSSSLRLDLFRRSGAGLERVRSERAENAVDGADAAFSALAGAVPLRAVAHRIVHGGRYSAACRIDDGVEREIERCAAFAPLHNPPALRWLRAARAALGPAVPQVAVFDTAFFHDLPAVAARYALPGRVRGDPAPRRQGFHGIAHRAMWRAWRAQRPEAGAGGRVITLQLGAGCSVAAIDGGRPVDTSMGFTPLEGLMMATRCGDIDPGLLLYLQRMYDYDVDALESLLTRESGLAGVSGSEGDMRALLASADADAALAVDMFCYRARKYIGAYLAILGGADAILFGGGIGEHSPEVRRRILAGLDAFGIVLDDGRNRAATGGTAWIGAADAAIALCAVAVDEARELAEAAAEAIPDDEAPDDVRTTVRGGHDE